MKPKIVYISVAFLVAILGSIIAVKAQGPLPNGVTAAAGKEFTYQGQLKNTAGAPISSTCNFQFSLWDSLSDVTGQVGNMQPVSNVNVSNGLFTVVLNGSNAISAMPFDGNPRWLKIAVRCGADPGFTPLTPRQLLTGTPYALGLKLPLAEAISDDNPALAIANNGNGSGVKGQSAINFGVAGYTTNGTGVYGDNGNSDTTGHAGYFNGRVHVTQGLAVEGNLSGNNMPGLKFSQANSSGIILNPGDSTDFDILTINVPTSDGYLFLSAFVNVYARSGNGPSRYCQSFRIYNVTTSQYLVSTEARKDMGPNEGAYQTDLHLSWVIQPAQGTLVLKTNGMNCTMGTTYPDSTSVDHNFTAVYLPVLH